MSFIGGYQSDLPFEKAIIAASNQLLVDTLNGNDLTGIKGNGSKPYKTALAAEQAAGAGDVIIFKPGIHTDVGLGKDGITYYDEPGAVHTNLIDTDTSTYTDAGKGAISFNIFGYGEYLHDRQWNVNNWNIEIVTLNNAGSKVHIHCFKAKNSGTDGGLFKALNGSEIHVKAEELYSGGESSVSYGVGSLITLKARKADSAFAFSAYFGGTLLMDIGEVNGNVPNVFGPWKFGFYCHGGGRLEFNGVANFNPGSPLASNNTMIFNQNPGGINKGIIIIRGTINLFSSRLYGFVNGANPNENITQLEGEINLGPEAPPDISWNNATGTLITKNLVIRSKRLSGARGIVPAEIVQFHAENTTIILTPEEIVTGARAIEAVNPVNVFIKSLYTNASIDPVNNTIATGIIETNNLLITQ